jgi:signal transduction histidine kinase
VPQHFIGKFDVGGGLTRRTIVASAVLALLIGAAFAVLLRAVADERDSGRLATHSQEVLAAATGLERLVLDLETGQRGFVITGAERFLEPWDAARTALPSASRELVRLAAPVAAQERRAREIAGAVDSYAREYSVPLVVAARRDEASARSSSVIDEGKRRVDAIRRLFDRFIGAERGLFAAREERSERDARRAIIAATSGLAGSILLIVLFAAYLTRAIVLPVRRAAGMAGRLAGGDLATRMPETGVGEIGALERSFNTMGSSLEASRDELRLLAEEQAALRRVATLVARGVPAPELLDAVAAEASRLLGADATALLRYEADGTATAVGARGEPGDEILDGARYTLEGSNVSAIVLRTGRPARIDSYEGASGSIAAHLRAQGVHCSVGAPIVVDGRLWGVMVAAWKHDEALSADTEERMAQFTELVATAIANAENRAELAASRARVVATADETRRRIERDLHDGAQQRLTHTVITLKLARRALGDDGGPAVELVEEALEHAERATAELRDLAHGILPAALSRGGLRAGIETLVSRIRLPVSVDATGERLPPALEATAYFIVAEALTNVVKHARARSAQVTARLDRGTLRVEVRDDGVGGARLDGSSGLLGLHDRADAMKGELRVDSREGAGTVVAATLPVPGA